jgi:hypothetical protein
VLDRIRVYSQKVKKRTSPFLSRSTPVRMVRQLVSVIACCGILGLLAGCATEPESHMVSSPPPPAPTRSATTTTNTTNPDTMPAAAGNPANMIVTTATAATGTAIVTEAPALANSAPANQTLMINSSSMSVGGGKATLIIGPLRRKDGIYSGDYKVKVVPYFFENEKGRLAIVVSDESLAEINQGKVTAITGTAITSGRGGLSRHIDAVATPIDINSGMLKLWFMAGNKKMIFEPAYHVAKEGEATVLAQATESKP